MTAGNNAEVRCGCRKHAVTGLRCNRCDTPICPDCSKPGAVGFVCRKCAANRKNPIENIAISRLILCGVTGAALGMIGNWLLHTLPLGGLLMYVATYFVGSVSGDIVLRVAGRKRGLQLELVAAITVALGFICTAFLISAIMQDLDVAVVHILSGPQLVGAAIAGYGAYSRIRYI